MSFYDVAALIGAAFSVYVWISNDRVFRRRGSTTGRVVYAALALGTLAVMAVWRFSTLPTWTLAIPLVGLIVVYFFPGSILRFGQWLDSRGSDRPRDIRER